MWADVAKGLSILLVVLHHLTGKHYDMVVPVDLAPLAQMWLSLTAALKPLRIPLFFLLSGFFAASAVRRPWRDVLGARVASPYYLYALWLGIHAVIFSFAQTLPMNRTRNVEEMLLDLAYASTSLWFLYALALYFLLAKALHAADARVVIALAAAVAGLAPMLPIDEVNRVSVLANFVYFAVGAYFPDAVRRIANLRRRHTIATLVLAYAGLGGLLLWLGAARGWTILTLSIVAVPLAIRCAVAVSAWPPAATVVARVGQRTLPIYVLHVPVLALLHQLVTNIPMATPGPIASAALMAVYPVVATIAVAAVCLLIHSALTRYGFAWLFRRPQVRARLRSGSTTGRPSELARP